MPGPEGRPPRYFIWCPSNGRVEAPIQRRLRWRVHLEAICEDVAEALGCRQAPEMLVPGRVWSLGRSGDPRFPRNILLARGLSWPDAARVVGASRKIRVANPPILLTIGRLPPTDFWGNAMPAIVPLEAVTDLVDKEFRVDLAAAEAMVAGHELDARARKPRAKTTRRATRAADIDKLTQALRDHLRAARDHAWTAIKANKEPELLPRPSQKQLALQLGLTPSAVSRCLNDETAIELRTLWTAATDIEQTKRYRL